MKIELSENEIEAIMNINNRYYFGLFNEIVKNENEEYLLRDAIISIDKKIKENIFEDVLRSRGISC